MKKVILALMVVCASVFADGLVGVEVGHGKEKSESQAKINTGVVKVGYENESATLFVYVGMDHYGDHDGSAKYYGVEFDKKISDFFAGVFMGFGKKNMKGYEASIRDTGAKVGYMVDSFDVGLKFNSRQYTADDQRDRIVSVFVGYNFNL